MKILVNIIRDIRDIVRMTMAQMEVAAEAHRNGTTEHSAIRREIESWGLDVFEDEDEAAEWIILDSDQGLPEGWEWDEPAEYYDPKEVDDAEDN